MESLACERMESAERLYGINAEQWMFHGILNPRFAHNAVR